MVNRTSNKKGFSIAEALVSMLIMSVFFLATSKVATQRQAQDRYENIHGFYECYINNEGDFTETRAAENAITMDHPHVRFCSFEPPSGVTVAIIYGTTNGVNIRKSDEPQFNKPITIYNRNQLINFVTESIIGDVDPETGQPLNQLTLEEFKNFIRVSHPVSHLYEFIDEGEYRNQPAIFVSW